MLVCAPCKKEMTCERNSVRLRFADGSHVYEGDRYLCPTCGTMAVTGLGANPYHDDTPEAEWDPDLDIDMRPGKEESRLVDKKKLQRQAEDIEADRAGDKQQAEEEDSYPDPDDDPRVDQAVEDDQERRHDARE